VTEPNPNRPNRDPLGIAGMVAVGMAAAVLSFSTWVQLAESVGFAQTWTIEPPIGGTLTVRLAWLLPLAVDCYTLTVIRVWLNSPPGSGVVAYAKANAIGAIALTVAAQAAYHAFAAAGFGQAELWWFAIVIGGIPPLLLGLVMDLYTRLKHENRTPQEQNTPRAPVQVHIPPGEVASAHEPLPPTQTAVRPPATNRTKPKAAARTRTEPANVTALDSRRTSRTDEALMPTVRRLVRDGISERGRPPGIAKVRARLGINYDRTKGLIERAVAELNRDGGESADTEQEDSREPVSASA
jgi:hypothetical protein